MQASMPRPWLAFASTGKTARLAYALVVAATSATGCSSTATESQAIVSEDASVEASADDASAIDTGIDGASDALHDTSDAGREAGPECEVFGAPGKCLTVAACTALGDHSSYADDPNDAGPCVNKTECCIDTPDLADNPPIPTGYKLMADSMVTPEMSTWAVAILHDPITYPMYEATTKTFGTQLVLARVQWHPPDFQNSVIHRGVTLFIPG
jgi:hypothetical protein